MNPTYFTTNLSCIITVVPFLAKLIKSSDPRLLSAHSAGEESKEDARMLPSFEHMCNFCK